MRCANSKNICNSINAPSLDALRRPARTLAEYNEHGKWQQSYIWGNGLLAMNTGSEVEQLLTDGRGSITEALSATNTTTYRYDAFGNVTREGTSSNPFTYNQERFDFNANLQYLRARYVDLELSRFISRDTVLGTPEDPRTHNLYLYVQNDPLSHVDPSGNIANWQAWEHRIANCSSRCNRGLNIPSHRTSCASCGIPRPRCSTCNNGRNLSAGSPGRTCSRCNRQGRWVQPPGNPNPAAHRPPPSPLPGDPNRGIPSNRINRTQEAEDRTHFKVCIALPVPGLGVNFTVDWTATQITLRFKGQVLNVQRDPRECDTTFANRAIAQTLLGGVSAARIPLPIKAAVDLYLSGEITRASLTSMIVGLKIPGWFAIADANKRMADVSLRYTMQVKYTFRYSWIRPGHFPPVWVTLLKSGREISANRVTGSRFSISQDLQRMARERDRILARHIWYREALRR